MTDKFFTSDLTDKFLTINDIVKIRQAKFNELSERFREHLNTVPKEYRAAVVEDYLDKLVSNGWLRKEDRANIHYNQDYKG